MESAIPSHLRCPRTRPRRVPDDYVPPYPSFVARHAAAVRQVVMAYFGVQALERWAESHPTHVAIFGAAMKYLSQLGPLAKLELYHEVSVVQADEQFFEYLNCHPHTGLLRSG